MNCFSCGALVGDKISFRTECDKCGASLHCCQNCKYYQVGLYNDCKVPGTERVLDKAARNFCEEFSSLGKGPAVKDSSAKKRFEDLFK